MRRECRFKDIQSASHAPSRLLSILQQIFSKKRCMMMCEARLCGSLVQTQYSLQELKTDVIHSLVRTTPQKHMMPADSEWEKTFLCVNPKYAPFMNTLSPESSR